MTLTKNDFQKMGDIIDIKLDEKLAPVKKELKSIGSVMGEKLEPIRKDLKSIKRKLNTTIRTFDRDFNYHHRRLVQLEEKTGIKPPDFLQKIN